MDLIKNLSGNIVVIYEDESHIRDYQALRTIWSVKGRQKQTPTRDGELIQRCEYRNG